MGLDRFEFRPLLQPLLEQQRGSGTIQATTSISRKSMTFCGCPGAAVLVHPGQRKIECACQPQAIATAMVSLGGRFTSGIQRQADHQPLHAPDLAKALDNWKISLKSPAIQRWQPRHGDPEGVTTGQTNPATANIQAQNRTSTRHLSGDQGWAMAAAGLGAAVARKPDQRIG